MMISKITDQIFIGNADDARSLHHHRVSGVTCVLNCARDFDYIIQSTLPFKVGLIDGPGNQKILLKVAVELLDTLIKSENRVLVHCIAGISRSPTVVATYLSWKTGISLEEAVKAIQNVRPGALPKSELIDLARGVLEDLQR